MTDSGETIKPVGLSRVPGKIRAAWEAIRQFKRKPETNPREAFLQKIRDAILAEFKTPEIAVQQLALAGETTRLEQTFSAFSSLKNQIGEARYYDFWASAWMKRADIIEQSSGSSVALRSARGAAELFRTEAYNARHPDTPDTTSPIGRYLQQQKAYQTRLEQADQEKLGLK